MWAVRNGKFFGVTVRGHEYLDTPYREEIMYALLDAVEDRIEHLMWMENIIRGGKSMEVVRGAKKTKLRSVILKAVIETAVMNERGLSHLEQKIVDPDDPEVAYLSVGKVFHREFGNLWRDIGRIVKQEFKKYDATTPQAGPVAGGAGGRFNSGAELKSVQASISQLERVQSLVNRDLAKLRRAEARLG